MPRRPSSRARKSDRRWSCSCRPLNSAGAPSVLRATCAVRSGRAGSVLGTSLRTLPPGPPCSEASDGRSALVSASCRGWHRWWCRYTPANDPLNTRCRRSSGPPAANRRHHPPRASPSREARVCPRKHHKSPLFPPRLFPLLSRRGQGWSDPGISSPQTTRMSYP